jgi:hypothetical protein
MCYITLDLFFLLFVLYIVLLNRCVVINHANIFLDLFLKKTILHVQVSKKIRRNFCWILRILVILGVAYIFFKKKRHWNLSVATEKWLQMEKFFWFT